MSGFRFPSFLFFFFPFILCFSDTRKWSSVVIWIWIWIWMCIYMIIASLTRAGECLWRGVEQAGAGKRWIGWLPWKGRKRREEREGRYSKVRDWRLEFLFFFTLYSYSSYSSSSSSSSSSSYYTLVKTDFARIWQPNIKRAICVWCEREIKGEKRWEKRKKEKREDRRDGKE